MLPRPAHTAAFVSLSILTYEMIERGLNNGWGALLEWRTWSGPLFATTGTFLIVWAINKIFVVLTDPGKGSAT